MMWVVTGERCKVQKQVLSLSQCETLPHSHMHKHRADAASSLLSKTELIQTTGNTEMQVRTKMTLTPSVILNSYLICENNTSSSMCSAYSFLRNRSICQQWTVHEHQPPTMQCNSNKVDFSRVNIGILFPKPSLSSESLHRFITSLTS